MTSYAASLALSLTGYVALAASYFGWGALFSRFLHFELVGRERVFPLIWLGWCASLLVFQAVNFAVPINAWVSGSFFLVGLLSWVLALRTPGLLQRFFTVRTAVFGALLALLAVWTASWSMLPPSNYDSGLYHFNSIRWVNEYPIVPGIGNLHPRLAFNQSFFTYAASLNLSPYFGHGHNLANSFLLLLLMADCLFMVVYPNEGKGKGTKHVDTAKFFSLSLLLIAVVVVVTNSISSPAPDVATTVLQMVLFLYTAQYLEHHKVRTDSYSRSGIILILAATAVTVKLSMIAYAGTIALIVIGLLWRTGAFRDRAFRRRSGALFVLLLLIPGCWTLKAYVQSGYPLFPSTFAGIGFDWTVPRDWAISESRWIYSWARQPGVNPDIVLSSWAWFRPWLANILTRSETIVYPLSLSLIGLAVWVMLARFRSLKFTSMTGGALFLLPLPMFLGSVFWFFTAPDPRFAGALFLLLAPAVLYPLLKFTASRSRIDGMFLVILFTILANGSLALWVVDRAPLMVQMPKQGYGLIAVSGVKVQTTASGLQVLTPANGDQCWDSQLPCTPYVKKELHLRGNDIRSGFSLQ